MENKKETTSPHPDRNKRFESISIIGTIGLLVAVKFLHSANIGEETLSNLENYSLQQYALVHSTPELKKYAGGVVNNSESSSQTIFIDNKPFGSLDEVLVRHYRSHKTSEERRDITERDRGEFKVLDYFARREYPSSFD